MVSVDTLIERIWDGTPPRGATNTLQSYVCRLRRTLGAHGLGPALLQTTTPGYLLDIAPEATDSHELARAVADADRLARAGDLLTAQARLAEARPLWGGTPFADVPAAFLETERTRLTDLWCDHRQLAAELAGARGFHDAAVGDLTALIEQHPLREPLHAQLMTALSDAGRPAEALRHYARVRTRLADELGTDPSPALQALHTRILRHEPPPHAGNRDARAARPALHRYVASAPSNPAQQRRPRAQGVSATHLRACRRRNTRPTHSHRGRVR